MQLGARLLHSVHPESLRGWHGCYSDAPVMLRGMKPPQISCYAATADLGRPSANSSIILRLKAGMSSGLRLDAKPLSTTTSSSPHRAPALRMSTWIAGHDVIF